MAPATRTCPGCGLELERHDGPTHAYIGASPECWALYGQVLAREYEAPAYFAVHGLTVDTYAAQHPGSPGRRQAQSVFVHLIALCLALEHGAEGRAWSSCASACSPREAGRRPGSSRPTGSARSRCATCSLPATQASTAPRCIRWAASVWEAWRPHHERLRSWIEEAL